MTLEGEYYSVVRRTRLSSWCCRNPHDIGRRILLFEKNDCPAYINGRNPHDIGRRILLTARMSMLLTLLVAILMTLEGEYYRFTASFVG